MDLFFFSLLFISAFLTPCSTSLSFNVSTVVLARRTISTPLAISDSGMCQASDFCDVNRPPILQLHRKTSQLYIGLQPGVLPRPYSIRVSLNEGEKNDFCLVITRMVKIAGFEIVYVVWESLLIQILRQETDWHWLVTIMFSYIANKYFRWGALIRTKIYVAGLHSDHFDCGFDLICLQFLKDTFCERFKRTIFKM